MAQSKTGTREWSVVSINIQRGCEHNCRYCYARYNAVKIYKQCTAWQWSIPVINAAKVDGKYGFYDGTVMFPSTHDITPLNISECLVVLSKLLEAGNQVLIVTKPTLSCVQLMCEVFKKFDKKQITFRFTIGSMRDDILTFWEPGSALFEERLKSLSCAYFEGYETSVSCEPYLDGFPHYIYEACLPYLTDSFWLGKLRHFNQRVFLDGATDEQITKYVKTLQAAQSDTFVHELVHQLNGRQYIRWKDSIREIIEEDSRESERKLSMSQSPGQICNRKCSRRI